MLLLLLDSAGFIPPVLYWSWSSISNLVSCLGGKFVFRWLSREFRRLENDEIAFPSLAEVNIGELSWSSEHAVWDFPTQYVVIAPFPLTWKNLIQTEKSKIESIKITELWRAGQKHSMEQQHPFLQAPTQTGTSCRTRDCLKRGKNSEKCAFLTSMTPLHVRWIDGSCSASSWAEICSTLMSEFSHSLSLLCDRTLQEKSQSTNV